MKLYNLVELLVKDPMVNLYNINAIGVRRRLDRVNSMYKEAQAKKGSDKELVKYAVKLLLPKFNGCIMDWPTLKKRVENSLRKVNLEKWLYAVDETNIR